MPKEKKTCVRFFRFSDMRFPQIFLGFALVALVSSSGGVRRRRNENSFEILGISNAALSRIQRQDLIKKYQELPSIVRKSIFIVPQYRQQANQPDVRASIFSPRTTAWKSEDQW